MNTDRKIIERFYNELSPLVKETVDSAVNSIVTAKENGGKVVVVTGSGPNLQSCTNVILVLL